VIVQQLHGQELMQTARQQWKQINPIAVWLERLKLIGVVLLGFKGVERPHWIGRHLVYQGKE
jgi:hypothetical protein